jgi:hypothetical protein
MSLFSRFTDAFSEKIHDAADVLSEKVHEIPLHRLGLENIPAVPFKLHGLVRTLISLGKRNAQTQQPAYGLKNVYEIGGHVRPAHAFLWGDQGGDDESSEHRGDLSGPARAKLVEMLGKSRTSVGKLLLDKLKDEAEELVEKAEPGELTQLSLEHPEQFAMSWTTFPNVDRESAPLLPGFASTLDDAEVASREFWPTIARYGLPYNLLLPEKVGDERAAGLRTLFGEGWSAEIAAAQAAGRLFVIDLGIFETVAPHKVAGGERFCPATVTLLRQDAATKSLQPAAVRVSGEGGRDAATFVRGTATDSAWLYALQAAKASIGVYGIWLGHVYHWHIPTAAMQMTMYNALPEHHVLYRLLEPHSKYLIEFDTTLLLLWEHIAPPTPIGTARQFIHLEDTFAAGRTFFDDDPHRAMEKLGISAADFTPDGGEPWAAFGFVRHLLEIWAITGTYVEKVVAELYPNDAAVAADRDLQRWMRLSADPDEGNIRGLPEMDSLQALTAVLHSFLYRITAHGTGRLINSANPGLTFVANFPPCLERTDIPAPQSELGTRELLTYLPRTGTIGEYLTFFYTFSFSVPYESLIPVDGIDQDLYFAGDTEEQQALNEHQIAFRQAILGFMADYQDGNPQVTQWPRNVET